MFSKAGAGPEDSEGFVDYPRFVSGVEIAVLIRQTGENDYKFSLRSNSGVNVAQLASRFGGGGHEKAAGIDCHGSIGPLKEDFLREAAQLLNGIPN
jgi:phosphoesterase RecJ-like protein